MLDYSTLSRAELVNRIRSIDPDAATGIRIPVSDLAVTLAALVDDMPVTVEDDPELGDLPAEPADFLYTLNVSPAQVVGKYALHPEDLDCGIGTDGVASEAMGTDLLVMMEQIYSSVDQTDDKVRHVNVNKDGIFKGKAPRLMAASVLGFTTETLEAPQTWATRSNLRVWDYTAGGESALEDQDLRLADAPTVKVPDDEGVPTPVIRPTARVVDFAIPVANAQRAIAVFYRDSTEKHDAISGLRKGSFLGVVPSGKGHAVKAFVTPKTIAQVLVGLGVGLPSQAADGSDLPEGKRPLVVLPAFDPAVADYLGVELGYDADGIKLAMDTLAESKYALAAARASGSKVRENDESARRAQDGRHHEFRLRDSGATILADAAVAAARAAR